MGVGGDTHATGFAGLLGDRQFLGQQLQRPSVTRPLDRGFGFVFCFCSKLIFAPSRHGGLRKHCRADTPRRGFWREEHLSESISADSAAPKRFKRKIDLPQMPISEFEINVHGNF